MPGARVTNKLYHLHWDPVLGPGSSLYNGERIQCWEQGPHSLMGSRYMCTGPGDSRYSRGGGIQCWGQGPPCMMGRGSSAWDQDPPCMMGRGSSAGARVLPV